MMRRWRSPLVRGSLILMETLWVYALLAFAIAVTVGGGKPTFPGVLLVVGGSFLVSRFLRGTSLSLPVVRIWGTLLSLILFYAVVRIDFYGNFAMWDFRWLDQLVNDTRTSLGEGTRGSTALIGVPLLLIFWMRGILAGQQTIRFEDVLGSFALGFTALAIVLALGSLSDELPKGVELVAIPYVAVGLMALGLQHASQASDSFERDFAPVWLVAIVGAVAVMASISLLFVLIDFGTARDGLATVGFAIGWVLAGIVVILSWPIIKFFEGAFWLVDFLAGGFSPAEDPPPVQVAPDVVSEPQEAADNVLPGWVRDLIRYAMASLIFVTAAAALALLFQRFQKQSSVGDNKDSVYTEGRLAADLGNLLGSLFRRGNRARTVPANEPARRLYFDMLAAAERRGVTRQPTETPLDLAPRLQSTFRSETPGEITRMFDDVRYGGVEIDEESVGRLRSQWERLQET